MVVDPPGFLEPVFRSSVTAELVRRLTERGHVSATGQWGSCALVLAAAVQQLTGRPMLVVTAHLDEADDALDQLEFFRPGAAVKLFPAFEVLPGESNLSHELAAQRLDLLAALAGRGDGGTEARGHGGTKGGGDDGSLKAVLRTGYDGSLKAVLRTGDDGSLKAVLRTGDDGSLKAVLRTGDDGSLKAVLRTGDDGSLKAVLRTDFIVAPVQALMQPSPNRELLRELFLSLAVGQTLDRDALARWLTDHGYTRLDAVEDAGDFAVRGEIVDVWPPGDGQPLRIDFFGDQIETLARFDLESLGTIKTEQEARLMALGDRSTWPLDQTTTFLNYLPGDAIVWLVEPPEVQEQAKSYYDRLSDARGIFSPQAVLKNVQKFAWAELHQFGGEGPETVRLPCKSVQRFDTKADEALRELAELAGVGEASTKARGHGGTEGRRVVVVCDTKSETTRLTDLLDVKQPGASAKIEMPVGVLTLGFEWDEGDWGATREGDEGTEARRHGGTEGKAGGDFGARGAPWRG